MSTTDDVKDSSSINIESKSLDYDSVTSILETYPSKILKQNEGFIRFQTKYLHLSFDPYIMHEEIIAFFLPKGLCKIAVFQSDNDLRVFMVLDNFKDFEISKITNFILTPKYYASIFKGVIFRGLRSFESDINIFKNFVSITNIYKPLFIDNENFLVDLEVKDMSYFTKLLTPNYINKISTSVLIKYRNELTEYRDKLLQDLSQFNDICLNVNDKIESLGLDLNLSIANKNLEDKVLDLKEVINTEPLSVLSLDNTYIESDINTDKKDLITSSTVDKDNTKNFSVESEKSKFFNIINSETVTKENLNYISSLGEELPVALLKLYIEEFNINIRANRNDIFRIVASYYNVKRKPKTGDSNTWIRNNKKNLSEPFYSFFIKFF